MFSFHPRKSITTGEGGMLTTDDAALAERVRAMRNHGATRSEDERRNGPKPHVMPDFDQLGFNYRMTDLQAAIGIVQLAKLDAFVAERRRWAAWYSKQLGKLSWLQTPLSPAGYEHSFQSYVVRVDPARAPVSRNALMAHLQARGVATRPGTHAVHDLGLYRGRFALEPTDCPVAHGCAAQTLAIPLHNRLTPDDYLHVVEALCASV